MTDHRRIQRTLFRMQVDGGFARAVFAREPAALASSGLDEHDLALVLALDPRAVAADPGGRRRTQIVANAASEYPATLACAAAREGGTDLLERFAASAELHAAIREERGLPQAFGTFARRVAGERADPLLEALATLEGRLVELRRRRARDPRPPEGAVALSARADVVALPAGTHRAAEALRLALARDERPAPPPLDAGREELLLVAAAPARPSALAEAAVERLEPPADALFRRLARGPLGRSERERFARDHGATLDELDAFLEGFAAEGALLRG